jgi:hypothetical protein
MFVFYFILHPFLQINRLVLYDSITKYVLITDPETKLKLKAHLKTEADGKCKGQCVQVTQS